MKIRDIKTINGAVLWIDAELNILHIMIYILMGMQLGGKWWFLFGALSIASFVSMMKSGVSLNNLK
ncbi:MAG: hypothetical protein RBR97_20185 [Bacteroidales bacterium]|nr:hypothetical protein [Bacteroidales bacterium]